jgi:hypothetical protein
VGERFLWPNSGPKSDGLSGDLEPFGPVDSRLLPASVKHLRALHGRDGVTHERVERGPEPTAIAPLEHVRVEAVCAA